MGPGKLAMAAGGTRGRVARRTEDLAERKWRCGGLAPSDHANFIRAARREQQLRESREHSGVDRGCIAAVERRAPGCRERKGGAESIRERSACREAAAIEARN